MNKKRFIGVSISLVILGLIWTILTPMLFAAAQADIGRTAPHPGFIAPDFSLQTPQGETLSLADNRGQPSLVFLWASWCTVCKAAMPGLQSTYEDFAPLGFELFAINTTFQDSLPTAMDYYQAQGYTYPMLLDRDGAVSQDYQMRAIPTSVLVGRDGEVLDVIIGAGVSEGYLRARLNDLYPEGD